MNAGKLPFVVGFRIRRTGFAGRTATTGRYLAARSYGFVAKLDPRRAPETYHACAVTTSLIPKSRVRGLSTQIGHKPTLMFRRDCGWIRDFLAEGALNAAVVGATAIASRISVTISASRRSGSGGRAGLELGRWNVVEGRIVIRRGLMKSNTCRVPSYVTNISWPKRRICGDPMEVLNKSGFVPVFLVLRAGGLQGCGQQTSRRPAPGDRHLHHYLDSRTTRGSRTARLARVPSEERPLASADERQGCGAALGDAFQNA